MQLRDAVIDDQAAILKLLQFLNPTDPKLSETTAKSVFTEILSSRYFTILVAETTPGTIVGTCYLNVIPNLTRNAAPYAVIENVVTDPDYRRQGIGKTLMESAIQRAFDEGCYKVMLLTGRDDHGVVPFYNACGMNGSSKKAFIVRQND